MSPSEPSQPESRRLIDRWTRWVRGVVGTLPAWPFFLGIALSFGACAVAGRMVSGRPMFENFVRFFAPIQPQRYFYPTASQLAAHIRHTVPKDKALVLVGGASYFRGTGQNPADLWSLELQRQLGPRHAVVNFATDQADLTAFAAVVFAMLAAEYPQMVYVANGNLTTATPLDGGEDYRYLFWDAYYKGLLPPSVAGADPIHDLRRKQFRDPTALEVHLGQWLDQFAYACDLWTYLGYKRFFTVWTDEHHEAPFAPRRLARESDDPTLAAAQANTRRDAVYIEHSEKFARKFSRSAFVLAGGKWVPDTAAWDRFETALRTLFPAELRPRCLVVLLRANPFFMQSLSADERDRTEQIYERAQQTYERAGYQVVPLRAADFSADDFVDGGHLMASGGFKVATAVARRIEEHAQVQETGVPLSSGQSGPIEVAIALPKDRHYRQETVFSLVGSAKIESLAVEYQGEEFARLVYRADAKAAPIYSPSFAAPSSSAVHLLRVSTSSLYPTSATETAGRLSAAELAAVKSWLLVRLDGRAFWEVPAGSRDSPRGEVILGAAPPGASPATRFTGTFYAAERRPLSHRPIRRDEIGGGRLSLALAPTMTGRSFPLATTGKAGEGDVLFLRVTAAGNAILGYDHWGTAAVLSPEIPLEFSTSHVIEFHLPALARTGSVPELVVSVDGKIVWRVRVPFYRPAPENIIFGQNPIGATSSETTLLNGVVEGVLTPSWRG